MSLPPAEQLSRWTVGQVTNWLAESSLAVFRQEFLIDNIDGNKLLRMTPQDIDLKYKHIPKKKRDVLKGHVSRIENSRSLPSWTPQLPPRPSPGERARIPAPPPVDDNDDDDGWGTDFDEDDIDDYLEPAPQVPQPSPGHNLNEQMYILGDPKTIQLRKTIGKYDAVEQNMRSPPYPQSDYEIDPLADDVDNLHIQSNTNLGRSDTMIDRLRLQLAERNSAPPPRPPRGNIETPAAPRSGVATTHSTSNQGSPAPSQRRPMPPPDPRKNLAQPEDEYEIMNDLGDAGPDVGEVYMVPDTVDAPQNSYLDFSETCKMAQSTQSNRRDPPVEPSLPPRPARKAAPEIREPSAPDKDDLSTYPWYHGKIDRNSATKIFEREQQNGMFLIRKSERDPHQPYTLVIWDSNRIWNIPIRSLGNNQFAAGKSKEGETQFRSIVELVEHFKVTPLNLKSGVNYAEGSNVLTIPAPKR